MEKSPSLFELRRTFEIIARTEPIRGVCPGECLGGHAPRQQPVRFRFRPPLFVATCLLPLQLYGKTVAAVVVKLFRVHRHRLWNIDNRILISRHRIQGFLQW